MDEKERLELLEKKVELLYEILLRYEWRLVLQGRWAVPGCIHCSRREEEGHTDDCPLKRLKEL